MYTKHEPNIKKTMIKNGNLFEHLYQRVGIISSSHTLEISSFTA